MSGGKVWRRRLTSEVSRSLIGWVNHGDQVLERKLHMPTLDSVLPRATAK